MGYMVQKLVSPKFPEHHQFQQIWSCALSMPWARSLYIKVLLVPSVTAGELDAAAVQARVDSAVGVQRACHSRCR